MAGGWEVSPEPLALSTGPSKRTPSTTCYNSQWLRARRWSLCLGQTVITLLKPLCSAFVCCGREEVTAPVSVSILRIKQVCICTGLSSESGMGKHSASTCPNSALFPIITIFYYSSHSCPWLMGCDGWNRDKVQALEEKHTCSGLCV